MANNIEIKARVHDVAGVTARAESLADGPAELIEQRDTFFATECGRLKLREFADGSGELIAYVRDDRHAPTGSAYEIFPTANPAHLRRTLAQVPGIRGEVRKRRRLLLAGRTRIHLDDVDGIGDFVELEVVLSEGESAEKGRKEARELMRALGIASDDLVDRAYIDLIEASLSASASASAAERPSDAP